MELRCFQIDALAPEIAPARQQRAWMDDFPHRHPYRCLPMTIANAYGWELLCTVDFEAVWNGGPRIQDLVVHATQTPPPASSHFGGGVLTFHTGYLFQTDPEWELFAAGPTNDPKDGVAPLSGVIETHWLPFPFTMNWKFTRPGRVKWRKGEPFCLIYPLARGAVEETRPVIRRLDSEPELLSRYEAWRDSRGDFLQRLRAREQDVVREGWQRHYFRGEQVDDGEVAAGHLKKLHPAKPLRLTEEKSAATTPSASPSADVNEAAPTKKPIATSPADVRTPPTAPAATNLPPAAYLICTTPRCGSNLLAQGLESTGVAGRPEEFFDPVFEQQWRERLAIREEREYFPRILERGRSANGVFGAKLHQFQFANLTQHVALATKAAEPAAPTTLAQLLGPLKFVWLRREDKTLQAISWFKAGKTKQWFDLTDERAASVAVPEFDAATVARFQRQLTEFDEAWRRYFDEWKVEPVEITYEEFVADYHGTIGRVLDFLAPPDRNAARAPQPRYLRQADTSTYDMLFRMAELRPDLTARTPRAAAESARLAEAGAEQFRRGAFQAAEELLRAAAEWDPLSARIQHDLGAAVASSGRVGEAQVHFRRALARDPSNSEAWRSSGVAHELLGECDAAERHYRQAAALDPQALDLKASLARLAESRRTSSVPRTSSQIQAPPKAET